ncbi:unnamed protein product [Tilletia laevis]|uniref:Uncharacterized protein n=3 Tax=Tilletia TaxID=13289 RepID=A0A8X7MIU1_9BASI|nr:hypothetical protein CF336_g9450 [Tilletia laevis]KAE8180201.1 hypothetical protein CF328_g9246 [Tilletia controversa]KAE8236570.1 hypothetical protein A4X03_0g9392 [Tilletia caries]KAE8180320.1 hypothetical protein CF335_g9292 [Tilletia laevis]KAE8236308.1 hypothetical protein A4X06_0g9592 [Tilletia controversa]
MKPATTLLTIAAMAFVAQAAPVPLPNAIEVPKFQERAVAGLAGGIFEHLLYPQQQSSYLPRAAPNEPPAKDHSMDESHKMRDVVDTPSVGRFGTRSTYSVKREEHSHSSRSIGGNDYVDTLRIKRRADVVAAVNSGEAAARKAAEGTNNEDLPKWIALVFASGAIVDHFHFHHSHSSRSVAGNEDADRLRMKRAELERRINWKMFASGAGVMLLLDRMLLLPHNDAQHYQQQQLETSNPPASYPPASKKRDVVDTPSVGRFAALDLLGEA